MSFSDKQKAIQEPIRQRESRHCRYCCPRKFCQCLGQCQFPKLCTMKTNPCVSWDFAYIWHMQLHQNIQIYQTLYSNQYVKLSIKVNRRFCHMKLAESVNYQSGTSKALSKCEGVLQKVNYERRKWMSFLYGASQRLFWFSFSF